MSKRIPSQLTVSQAIDGYLLAARARRLSEATLANYNQGFTLFLRQAGDPPLAAVTTAHVRAFLTSLTWLSPKSVKNYHTALAALYTWAVQERLVDHHILHDVQAPHPPQREILPYTRDDLRAMLAACERSRAYTRPGKRPCDNARPTALRDRAIILLLLDTGIRASELCDLRIITTDLKNQRITVIGKGRRERTIPISPKTCTALWRYLATRPGALATEPLFLTGPGHPFDRSILRRLLNRLGEKAGIPHVNCHRFRHTCAIQFLRNGGNAFALQRLLGHSTLDMVRRYLALTQQDVAAAHREASPVTNWVL